MSDQPEALRLADELVAPVGTQSTYSVMQQAAAELRRLHTLAMDQQGEIYGLTFARETERKIHNLFKVERDALRAELREVTEATNDPAVNNIRTLAESIRILQAECDALRATLSRVADIAHAGVLISSDWLGFEVAIRRLTLPYFDRNGTIDNIKARAQAAIDAAREGNRDE